MPSHGLIERGTMRLPDGREVDIEIRVTGPWHPAGEEFAAHALKDQGENTTLLERLMAHLEDRMLVPFLRRKAG